MWDKMIEMRQECPVPKLMDNLYYTARYSETRSVFRDAQRFSCVGGFRAPGVEIPTDELFMSEMDRPLHPKLRKLLAKWFNPAKARASEPFTRSYVKRVFDELDVDGEGDLIECISSRVPIAVTGELLGIPVDDIPLLSEWIFALLHTDWPAYGVRGLARPVETAGLIGAAPELSGYVDDLITRTRMETSVEDSLMKQMVFAEIDGSQMSKQRVRSLIVNLLTAGLSTNSLMGNLLYRLVTSREFGDALRDDLQLVPVGVEESLRYEPPVMFLFRTAQEDADVGDVPVRSGDRIAVGIASANRDETVFARYNEFRLDPSH